MEPQIIGILASSLCLLLCVWAAFISIKSCGPALASVSSEKPELGRRLIITLILGEALAIYGLLISFMIISRLSTIQTMDDAWPLLIAAFTISGTAFAAGLGIAYCGPPMMSAAVSKPQSFAINLLGLILSEALAIYGLLISFMIIS